MANDLSNLLHYLLLSIQVQGPSSRYCYAFSNCQPSLLLIICLVYYYLLINITRGYTTSTQTLWWHTLLDSPLTMHFWAASLSDTTQRSTVDPQFCDHRFIESTLHNNCVIYGLLLLLLANAVEMENGI